MCRTTHTTHLLCHHLTPATLPCFRSRSNSLRSLFSSSPRKCIPTTALKETDDYCPSCSTFWDTYFVSEHSRRFRIKQFREATGYKGPVTPTTRVSDNGEAWFFGFVMDDDSAPRPDGNRSEVTTETEIENERAKFVSKGKEGWEIEDYESVLAMDRSRSKPPSISSAETVFPGEERKRKGTGPDEFGNDADSDSDEEEGSGFARPDVVNMRNLERGMSGLELKPVEPLPSVAPQRGKGEEAKAVVRRGGWQ
ncbi:hypothetical protein BDZ45DRAFT_669319 [Acephala macrosclerotiorum]|nr:hypothetical protein BDZ45DRAFT_669319 [Acephala macrosclerotiorum]